MNYAILIKADLGVANRKSQCKIQNTSGYQQKMCDNLREFLKTKFARSGTKFSKVKNAGLAKYL